MPQQPSSLPTPLDLARVRPRPAQPPPPRNRRQAEMQKDRARQELRALLADPAAGFAALPGGQFFAALKQACRGRHREPRADRGLRAQDHLPRGGTAGAAPGALRRQRPSRVGRGPRAGPGGGRPGPRHGGRRRRPRGPAAGRSPHAGDRVRGGRRVHGHGEPGAGRRARGGQGGLRRQQEDRAAGRGAVAAGSPLLEFGQLGPQAPDLAVDTRQLRPGLLFADTNDRRACPGERLALAAEQPQARGSPRI